MEPDYSFIVPVFNDGYLLDDFCQAFAGTFRGWLERDSIEGAVELIFVDDGSVGATPAQLREVAAKYGFVKTITLSRNFGQHIAISAGYAHATGRFVGMLNADQQDPPDQIPVLLRELDRGDCDIVYGLREVSKESWANRVSSKLFNQFLSRLTGYRVPDNVSTLRVMSRRFLDAYLRFEEKSRFLPGLENWLGFASRYVPITHQPRRHGRSSYNFRRRLTMALEAVVSFSDLPLRIVAGAGMVIALIGFALNLVLIIQRLFFIHFQPGFTATVSLIVFFGGLQILVMGLASIYIGRVLKEVQNRPLYVIKEKSGFDRPTPNEDIRPYVEDRSSRTVH
jgi:dolichol-phosphate mannosyltransferase